MATKQINGRVPPFMRDEYDALKIGLRRLGCKPTDGDLLAALIHAAAQVVEQTKTAVEDYVKYELDVVESSGIPQKGATLSAGGGPGRRGRPRAS